MTLPEAAEEGNFEYVKNNLTKNNINESDSVNWTPLHTASYKGDTTLIEYLLDSGADIEPLDIDNQTPLHIAVYEGKYNAASILLSRGANPNAQDRQQLTPLHHAVLMNRFEIFRLLLLYKSNQHIVSEKGYTALQMAEQMKRHDIITFVNNILSQEEYAKKQITTLLLSQRPDLESNSPAKTITYEVAEIIFDYLRPAELSPDVLHRKNQLQKRTSKHKCVIM